MGRKKRGGALGWIQKANPWSSYNLELQQREQRKKELQEFLTGFKAKGPINDMMTGIIDKKSDEYADCSLEEVKKFLAMAGGVKDPILITELARAGPELIKACIDEWQYNDVRKFGRDLMETDMRTAIAFIKKSIELISSDRNMDIKSWAEKGMEIEDPMEKFLYFRGTSKQSQDVLGLGKRRVIELQQVMGSLKLFGRLISAKPISIEPTNMAAHTDGTIIFLPPKEEEFPTKDLNRRKLRALTLHEARHAKESFYVDLSKIDVGLMAETLVKDRKNKVAGAISGDVLEILEKIGGNYRNPFKGIVEEIIKLGDKGADEDDCAKDVLELLKQIGVTKKELKGGFSGSKQAKVEYLTLVLGAMGIKIKSKVCDDCACLRLVIEKTGDDEFDNLMRKFDGGVKWHPDGDVISGGEV